MLYSLASEFKAVTSMRLLLIGFIFENCSWAGLGFHLYHVYLLLRPSKAAGIRTKRRVADHFDVTENAASSCL